MPEKVDEGSVQQVPSSPFNLYKVKRMASAPLKMGAGLGVLDVDLPASGNVSDIVDWSKARSESAMGGIDPSDSYSGMAALSNLIENPADRAKRIRHEQQVKGVLALGDAIRHIGNIFNTVNGAPVQQFNSPVLDYQKQTDNNDALRLAYMKQAMAYEKAKGDLAYKNRVMDFNMRYKDKADQLAQDKFAFEKWKKDQDLKNKDGVRDLNERKFQYQQDHDKVKDGFTKRRLDISASKGSGSGSKDYYRVYNPKTGQYETFHNQAARDQRAAELGYEMNDKSSSSSSSNLDGTKKNSRSVRTNRSVSLGQQEAKKKQQRKRKNSNIDKLFG